MKVHIGPWPNSRRKGKRKIKIKIDNYDLWCMDDTLTMIILPMLKRMRVAKCGGPFVDDKDVPEGLRSYNDNEKKKKDHYTDKYWFKRWDWVLDEMIWAFQQLHDAYETQFYSSNLHNLKHVWVETSKSVEANEPEKCFERVRFTKKLRAALEPNCEVFLRDNHWKKVQNGLRLFAKYYCCLWT